MIFHCWTLGERERKVLFSLLLKIRCLTCKTVGFCTYTTLSSPAARVLSLSWMSLQVKKKKTISAAAAVNLVVLVDWTQKLQTSNTLDIYTIKWNENQTSWTKYLSVYPFTHYICGVGNMKANLEIQMFGTLNIRQKLIKYPTNQILLRKSMVLKIVK